MDTVKAKRKKIYFRLQNTNTYLLSVIITSKSWISGRKGVEELAQLCLCGNASLHYLFHLQEAQATDLDTLCSIKKEQLDLGMQLSGKVLGLVGSRPKV